MGLFDKPPRFTKGKELAVRGLGATTESRHQSLREAQFVSKTAGSKWLWIVLIVLIIGLPVFLGLRNIFEAVPLWFMIPAAAILLILLKR